MILAGLAPALPGLKPGAFAILATGSGFHDERAKDGMGFTPLVSLLFLHKVSKPTLAGFAPARPLRAPDFQM